MIFRIGLYKKETLYTLYIVNMINAFFNDRDLLFLCKYVYIKERCEKQLLLLLSDIVPL
jgi:adenine-specific DNA methylase